jgi:hypothetical protein
MLNVTIGGLAGIGKNGPLVALSVREDHEGRKN